MTGLENGLKNMYINKTAILLRKQLQITLIAYDPPVPPSESHSIMQNCNAVGPTVLEIKCLGIKNIIYRVEEIPYPLLG